MKRENAGARHYGRLFSALTMSSALILAALVFVGCATETETTDQTAAAPLKLPVSLNDVMVALVNQAADPIWVAAWHNPSTDEEWRELERRATQLEIAGALLPIPGTGPVDDEWVSQPNWSKWAGQLRDVGAEAVVAVHSRDLEAISATGDKIVEVCEGCHAEFKLDLPTGGKFGELSPTAADLGEEEDNAEEAGDE